MKNAHLVEQHIGLARAIAKGSQIRACHFELSDLLSVAHEALVKAALSFNGDGEFRHWARWKIKHEIMDYKRKFGIRSRFGGFATFQLRNKKMHTEDGVSDDGNEISGEGSYEMHGLGFSLHLSDKAMDKPLSQRERFVLHQRYFAEESQSSIAKALGLSETGARVSQIERGALPRLKKAYERMGITRLEQVL